MRTYYCGEVKKENIGETVTLCGWVNRRRDHGGVIFIDLRDREGLVQIVFDPDISEAFATAEKVRSEYVLAIQGEIRKRPPGTENSQMPTGQVEVLARQVKVLNEAETPPFQLDEAGVEEEM